MRPLDRRRRQADHDVVLADGARMRVAPMRRRDLRAGVLDVENASHQLPWSTSVFTSEIEQIRTGSRHYIAGRIGGKFVGHAGLWFAPDEAHVTNVAVAPAHRRRGIARALLLQLADEAIRRGVAAWTLEVRASSAGAQELYRSFGFAPAGVRKKYYDNVEDAIVMWCHDIDTIAYGERLDALRGASDPSSTVAATPSRHEEPHR